MLVLALDTSTLRGTVAVLDDDRVLSEAAPDLEGKHGELLIGTIAECLEGAGRTMADVELIAVGLGPGSFTGVRIGVATAKGLALANGLPLVGVVSLAAIARALGPGDGLAVPITHAHRGEVFSAVYRRTEAGPVEVLAPFNALPTKAIARIRAAAGEEPLVVVGDAFVRYEDALGTAFTAEERAPEALAPPTAAAIGREALRRFGDFGADDLAALEPLYVRGSDAKLPATPLKI